jgi:hypothetical protein
MGGWSWTIPEGTRLMLADLPDEAYRVLLELDWTDHRGGCSCGTTMRASGSDPNRRYP